MQQAAAAAAATGDHGGNMSSEQMMKDKMFVKQHIRQAVLQRVGSKSHMENVDEETEARLAQVRGWNSFLGGRWWGGVKKTRQTLTMNLLMLKGGVGETVVGKGLRLFKKKKTICITWGDKIVKLEAWGMVW